MNRINSNTHKLMIKFVYFDVGQVLVSNNSGLEKFWKKNGWNEETKNLFWKAWMEVSDKLCEGKISEAEATEFIEDNARVDLGDGFSLINFTVETFAPIKETQELLLKIRGKYRFGLLSNAYEEMIQGLIGKNKLPNINYEVIVDSFEEKAVKPDTKIFEVAVEKAQVEPSEILFIDDSEEHTEAAKSLGWNVYRFDEDRAEECVGEIEEILSLE